MVVWGLEPLHCQALLALMEPDSSGKQGLYFTTCLTFFSHAGWRWLPVPLG